MTFNQPTLLALDFDGVLCDGLREYFQTAWRTYCQLWSPSDAVPSEELAARFYRTRPVIEIGWEMPILIRALVLGISEAEILGNWPTIAQQIVAKEQLKADVIGPHLDKVRDQWIETDLSGWLSLHQFYPGVINRIQPLIESSIAVYIITTKEERFVRSLLEEQEVNLQNGKIFGKGYKKPKSQILRELLATSATPENIWFVEDRLQTLISVLNQPDLNSVQLFLADWGYNTQKERDSVVEYPPIQLLSLSQFSQNFSDWR